MNKVQAVGFILWRGGFLFVGGCILYYAIRQGLRFAKFFGIKTPLPVEIGVCLILAGALFVVGSLIAERIQDSRREEGLQT
ncbi:MAG: hypothetical protein H6751_12140 [Candidatus Omnitrophica bacterium]|nr:hypothetical protein [Candidatus Omnitrophota bacterium]MCB9783705.1 hypothetical protein [Candidatus Omnitrophota bacterium]